MYSSGAAPKSQKVRPITFVLNYGGSAINSVTLPIRPEDLNRVESSRVTVHQTLGRRPIGWADNFGEGLPSLTISGHTGWRVAAGLGMDGFDSFEALNQLVQRDYHQAKQEAIDSGQDPAMIHLLFVDTLDNFAWVVVPTQFVLRRSKSRPLLYQYQISLQALSTDVQQPNFDSPQNESQETIVTGLSDASFEITDSFADLVLVDPLAASFSDFVQQASDVFSQIQTLGITEALSSGVVQMALDMAQVGANAFRSMAAGALDSLGSKQTLIGLASRFAEAGRLASLLMSQSTFEDYTQLYLGTDKNVATLMLPTAKAADLGSAAAAAMAAVKTADPVLSPMSRADLAVNLQKIADGVSL